MVVGRWSLVVASIAFLPLFANAEETDLKLKCKVNEEISNDRRSFRKERIEYLTFTDGMSRVKYGRLNIKCEKLTKTEDHYVCNSTTDSDIMKLDRRSLKLKGSIFTEHRTIDFEGVCEISTMPKI
ncbi:hypothetical protein CXF85_10180 [Colwellia sp. 75C3]|uniref:hypothetical protein n=1 Tax=Colwellia sp. 75C3 TaxID=888425 RepID=UPI000C3414A1|nr:hypothetical protein [Colwellia sp. 75C3]PKG83856.1 hypothetical protein CXF85_10180 [Colwellia sp. 75C3]